jgi:hypothetical protein
MRSDGGARTSARLHGWRTTVKHGLRRRASRRRGGTARAGHDASTWRCCGCRGAARTSSGTVGTSSGEALWASSGGKVSARKKGARRERARQWEKGRGLGWEGEGRNSASAFIDDGREREGRRGEGVARRCLQSTIYGVHQREVMAAINSISEGETDGRASVHG